jgi:hypothetical protein
MAVNRVAYARNPKTWCAHEARGDVGGRCFSPIATYLVVVKSGVPDGGCMHVLMKYTPTLSHHLIFRLETNLVCLRVSLPQASLWTRVERGHAPTYQQTNFGHGHTMKAVVPL